MTDEKKIEGKSLTAYFDEKGVRFDVIGDVSTEDLIGLGRIIESETSLESIIGRRFDDLEGRIKNLEEVKK